MKTKKTNQKTKNKPKTNQKQTKKTKKPKNQNTKKTKKTKNPKNQNQQKNEKSTKYYITIKYNQNNNHKQKCLFVVLVVS